MAVIRPTLWEAIEALSRQVPLTKDKIELTLSTALNERVDRSNSAYRFFWGGRVELEGDAALSKIEFRTRWHGTGSSLLVLDLEGACITVEDVRRRYSALEITDIPRGHSLDEATTFSTVQPWGDLSFGFRERNRERLAFVVLEPRAG